MFNLLGMLVSGLIIGALARWFYPGNQPLGFLLTIGLGIAGSLVGGLLGQLAKPSKEGIRLNRGGLILSVIGALLVLWGTRQLGWW
jgi:uncharacterized membrane protein YeaQ/YmgE (transglycosylase-associated protein family)